MNQLTLPGVPSVMSTIPGYSPSYAPGLANFGSPVAPAPATNFTGLQSALGGAISTAGGIDVVAPQAATPFSLGGTLKNTFLNEQGGLNLGGMGDLATGLGALGSVWAAFQANKVANKTLDFQTKAYETNLANQTQSYNTALEDRANARAVQNNAAAGTADAYVNKHKLGA